MASSSFKGKGIAKWYLNDDDTANTPNMEEKTASTPKSSGVYSLVIKGEVPITKICANAVPPTKTERFFANEFCE